MFYTNAICINLFKFKQKRRFLKSLGSFSCYSTIMNSKHVYVRLNDDGKTFVASFEYEDKALNINRLFTVNRYCSETIKDFTSRISCNVEKFIVSKIRKLSKKNDESPSMPKINVTLMLNGEAVSLEETCQNVLFECKNSLILRVVNTDYSVIINPPWIHTLLLPNAILAGFPFYPKKFQVSFTSKAECKFLWFKSKDKPGKQPSQCSYVEAGTGFIYNPVASDIGSYIKLQCTPRRHDEEGPMVEVYSHKRVEAGPGHCPFETRHKFTSSHLSGNSFRVVSYNILADLYAASDVARTELFPYCPSYALDVDYRKLLLIKELIGYNADLICLQEVDLKVFKGDLDPVFKSLNYEGVLAKKGGQVAEGVTCFFRPTRLRLLNSYKVVLGEEIANHPCFSKILNKMNEFPVVKAKVLERTTILQVIVFDVLDKPNHRLIVGNTHLYFKPTADHIRLLQTGLSIAYIQDVVEKIKKSNPALKTSVIFCGDFNSTPDCGVYKLMTENTVPEDYTDWKSQKGEHVEGLSLSQPFSMASACGTPEFTNYTTGFAGCLDYIFFETKDLHVEQVVPFPSKDELSLYKGIPSVVFPSDHIALIADLKWTH